MPRWWQQPDTHPSDTTSIVIDLTDEEEKIASMQNYKSPQIAGKIDITIKENGSVTLTTTSQKPVPFSTDPTGQTTEMTSNYFKQPQAFSSEKTSSTWELSPTSLADKTVLNIKSSPALPSVRVVDCAKYPLTYKKNVSKTFKEKNFNDPNQLALHILQSVTEDKSGSGSVKNIISFNADQLLNNAETYRRINKTPQDTSRRTTKYENFMKTACKNSDSKNNKSFVGIKMKKTWKTITTPERKSTASITKAHLNKTESLIDMKKQQKTERENNTQTNKRLKHNKYDKNPNSKQISELGVSLNANSMRDEDCNERNEEQTKNLVLSDKQKNNVEIDKNIGMGIDFKMNKGFIGMKIQNPLSTDIDFKRHKSLKGIKKQRKNLRKNNTKTNRRTIHVNEYQINDKKTKPEQINTINLKSKEVEGLKASDSITMQDEVCQEAKEELKLSSKIERDIEIENKTVMDYKMNKNLIGLKIHKEKNNDEKKIIADSVKLKCKPNTEKNTEAPINMDVIYKELDRYNTMIEPVFINNVSNNDKNKINDNLSIESEILKAPSSHILPSVSISITSGTKQSTKNDFTVNNPIMESSKTSNLNNINIDNSLEKIVTVTENTHNEAKSSMSKHLPKMPVIPHSAPTHKQSDAFTKTLSKKLLISSNEQQKTAAQPKIKQNKVNKTVTSKVPKEHKRNYQQRVPPNQLPFSDINEQNAQMRNFLEALRNPNQIVNWMRFGNYMQPYYNNILGNYWPPPQVPQLSVKPTVAKNPNNNQKKPYNLGEIVSSLNSNLEKSKKVLSNEQCPNLSNVIGGQMMIDANTKYSQAPLTGLITHRNNTNQDTNKNLMFNGTVNNIETSSNETQNLPKIPFTVNGGYIPKSPITKQSDVFTKPYTQPLPSSLNTPHKTATELHQKRTGPPEAHTGVSLPIRNVSPKIIANHSPLRLPISHPQQSVSSSSASTTVIDYSAHTSLKRPFPNKTCLDETVQSKQSPCLEEILKSNTSIRPRGNGSQGLNMQLLDGDTEKLLHQIDSFFDSEL